MKRQMLAVVLFVMGSLLAACQKSYLKQAQEAMRTGSYELAAHNAKLALEKDPGSLKAKKILLYSNYKLGRTYYRYWSQLAMMLNGGLGVLLYDNVDGFLERLPEKESAGHRETQKEFLIWFETGGAYAGTGIKLSRPSEIPECMEYIAREWAETGTMITLDRVVDKTSYESPYMKEFGDNILLLLPDQATWVRFLNKTDFDLLTASAISWKAVLGEQFLRGLLKNQELTDRGRDLVRKALEADEKKFWASFIGEGAAI